MEYTTVQEVFDSFESSFRDKEVIPDGLKLVWLKKAVARYSMELDPIEFNEDDMIFEPAIDQYVVDTLAAFMKQMYQERETSKVNKRVSISGKDITVDGGGHSKTAARNELMYDEAKSGFMISKSKPYWSARIILASRNLNGLLVKYVSFI